MYGFCNTSGEFYTRFKIRDNISNIRRILETSLDIIFFKIKLCIINKSLCSITFKHSKNKLDSDYLRTKNTLQWQYTMFIRPTR